VISDYRLEITRGNRIPGDHNHCSFLVTDHGTLLNIRTVLTFNLSVLGITCYRFHIVVSIFEINKILTMEVDTPSTVAVDTGVTLRVWKDLQVAFGLKTYENGRFQPKQVAEQEPLPTCLLSKETVEILRSNPLLLEIACDLVGEQVLLTLHTGLNALFTGAGQYCGKYT